MGLIDRLLALDEGEDREAHRDQEGAEDAADQCPLATRGGAPTLDDVTRLFGGRLLTMTGVTGQPGLRIAQVAAAQQETLVAVGVEPLASSGGKARVLVAPVQVGFQRLDELCDADVEVVSVAQEDPLSVGDAPGQGILVNLATDDRDDQLVQSRGLFELQTALRGGKRLGGEHKDQSPTGRNPAGHAVAPFRSGEDVFDIDPDVLVARRQSGTQPVDREAGVLSCVAEEGVVASGLFGSRPSLPVCLELAPGGHRPGAIPARSGGSQRGPIVTAHELPRQAAFLTSFTRPSES